MLRALDDVPYSKAPRKQQLSKVPQIHCSSDVHSVERLFIFGQKVDSGKKAW